MFYGSSFLAEKYFETVLNNIFGDIWIWTFKVGLDTGSVVVGNTEHQITTTKL